MRDRQAAATGRIRLVPHVLRRFGPLDSLEGLTALLHQSYAAHAAAGRRFVASHQSLGDTRRRIARGECWLASDGQDIIGTVTVVAPCAFPPGYPAPDPAGTFYQLAVLPTHQGRGLGGRLLEWAEARVRALGPSAVAIDTSATAADLIAWYARRGYAPSGVWKWDVTNDESLVLIKHLA
jgi:GNAT superfamily N-acetyltransferase